MIPHRPLTLQARLVLVTLALLATACLVLGAVSVLTMQHFLVGRLDEQLRSAVARTANFDEPPDGLPPESAPRPPSSAAPDFLLAPGQGQGTLGARITDGDVVEAGVLDAAGERVALPAAQAEELTRVPTDGVPRTIDLAGLGGFRAAASTTPDGVVLLTGLPTDGVTSAVRTLAAVAFGVGFVVLVLCALIGRLLVRGTLRPLVRVAATARAVTTLPLHAGEVSLPVRVPVELTDARTEVGQVGGALNQLIDHVGDALTARQASETKLRQFVADASHELRTPLAAIRGYAELTRRSRATTPPDVGAALDRVESAAQRMTGLVEDLLLLARLDAGRGVEHAEVDLTALCLDNLADAQAAGPDHVWSAELPDEPVGVSGDGPRLHQVVANLLANARVHTPPGTRVALRIVAPVGDAPVVVEVHDDGPGIPQALLPHVFERFARGDSSRSRQAGSTGLGLSIVAAVVGAHGGLIEAESAPGRTVVRVTLPGSAMPARSTADAQPARREDPPGAATVGA